MRVLRANNKVLVHNLNSFLGSDNNLCMKNYIFQYSGSHVDEQAMVNDASDVLNLAVDLFGIVNTVGEAKVDDVVSVISNQTRK